MGSEKKDRAGCTDAVSKSSQKIIPEKPATTPTNPRRKTFITLRILNTGCEFVVAFAWAEFIKFLLDFETGKYGTGIAWSPSFDPGAPVWTWDAIANAADFYGTLQ